MNQVLAQLDTVLNSQQANELIEESSNIYSSYLPYLPLIKTVSIILSVLFIAGTIFSAVRTGWLALRVDRVRDVILKSNMPKKRSIKVWQTVQRHFYAGDDNSLKLALLEADKVLDEALRVAGFRGENLGDRLKNLDESKLPNLQEVWEAHKLRNRLVHETDFKLNRDMAEKALGIYEKTFRDLGLLD